MRQARNTNHERPLVPVIDCLLCLVTFLLSAAGFADLARLSSGANVPERVSELSATELQRLHVDVHEHTVHLTWQSGATVLVSNDLPLESADLTRAERPYPALTEFLGRDWRVDGSRRDSTDPAPDEAGLHVRNAAAYDDVVAAPDAVRARNVYFRAGGGHPCLRSPARAD